MASPGDKVSVGFEGAPHFPLVTLTASGSVATAKRTALVHQDCDCDCACSVSQSPLRSPLAAPITCYLELTAACPNRCAGCGNVFVDRTSIDSVKQPLSAEQWRIIIEKLEPSVSIVRLTGGEPTVHPEFLAIVDILEANGIPFALLTSGRWPRPQALIHRLATCHGLRGMLISLHGPNQAVHEAFTNARNSFHAAEYAISLAVDSGIAVAASTVLIKANLGHLRPTVEKALSLGANSVVFNRFIGPAVPGLTLHETELKQAIREVQALAEASYPVRFGNCIPQCFEPNSSHGCTAGITYCTVDPWGTVRPCNHAMLSAGNLLSLGLQDIWHSDTMAQWRQLQPTVCQTCPAYETCLGGCRAIELGRDPLMIGPSRSLANDQRPRQSLVLASEAIPVPQFDYYRDERDLCLVHDGRAARFPLQTKQALDDLFSNKTLAQLEQVWGVEGLAMIGWLYVQHFLDLSYHTEEAEH